MNLADSTESPKHRTGKWAWVVVLGTPLIALALILFARLIRPEFDASATMKLSPELMVSYLPVRNDAHIMRMERANFADCNNDGIPEIGFDAMIRYGGIFEGKWDVLNVASYLERRDSRGYSVISGAEVLNVESPLERTVKFVRSDETVCVHPGGNGVDGNCTASEPCRGVSFPNSHQDPWRFYVGEREFQFNTSWEPNELLIEDLGTGEAVFSKEQQEQRISWSDGFGSARLLWRGVFLEVQEHDDPIGHARIAQVFRFGRLQSVKKYTLPEGCSPVVAAFEEARFVRVNSDGAVVFLAKLEEERVDEGGEMDWPIARSLVEIQLGEEAVVRPIFDQLGDDLVRGGAWGFSGAVACRDSAFFMAPIESEAPNKRPKFRVRTPWIDEAAEFTPPDWLPTEQLMFKWASVLPDVDADGFEDCLMVWFGYGDPFDHRGLISFIISGATGQPVRRDTFRLPPAASE